MKRFDSIKGKYIHFFSSIDIVIDYLHKCHIDFTFEIIGQI